jgi:hypothetical protein
MLHSSTQKLIQKLCDLTAAGNIAWRDDEHDRVVFETEGYLVEAGANPPNVRLLRTDGQELESASEADLAGALWPDGNGTYATHVSEMVRQAQRIARGAEQAISKILSSLSAPPLKVAELEPFPAALEFDPPETRQPSEPEPPPASHSVADAPPDSTIHPPHAETAIAAVLAAAPPMEESISEIAIESAPVEPEAETTVAAAEEELPLEEAPLPEPAAKIETASVARTPAPEPRIATTAATRLFAAASFEPEQPKQPRSQFGETLSFARPTVQKPAPAPEPAAREPVTKVTSTGLFITGISATTRQTVRGELPPERPERPEPAPQPVPTPVAQAPAPKPEPPAPKPEPPAPRPRLEPAAVAGHDIYKPWA